MSSQTTLTRWVRLQSATCSRPYRPRGGMPSRGTSSPTPCSTREYRFEVYSQTTQITPKMPFGPRLHLFRGTASFPEVPRKKVESLHYTPVLSVYHTCYTNRGDPDSTVFQDTPVCEHFVIRTGVILTVLFFKIPRFVNRGILGVLFPRYPLFANWIMR